MNSSNQILQFYGWWEFSTCLFAFLGLMSIWYHLGRKKGDLGQVWLAISILCWSISGVIEIVYLNVESSNNLMIQGWRSVFSLLNSLFILFAIPWFKHLPQWLKQAVQSRYWYLIVGLPFIFCMLPTISKMVTGTSHNLISELDVYYAILTLIILGLVLWQSFKKRGLHLLAYLSTVFILITLVAQLYKFTDDEGTLLLYSAIFKTALIMIFFALALSWVKDLSETLKVATSSLAIKLYKDKSTTGKVEHILQLGGFDSNQNKLLQLTKGNYDLLYRFLNKKIENPTEGWLEIKPKSISKSAKIFDIQDYNEIKRLLNNILDGIYGKSSWTKERHGEPLKAALFEFSKEKGRRIRIKTSPDMIFLDDLSKLIMDNG